MKMNGISLITRGKERVYVYGDWMTKTVYSHPDKWKFYIKLNGEFIEVYHKACWFSTKEED